MRISFTAAAIVLAAMPALASPPEFEQDPFGDNDFGDSPMILDVAHPTRGRAEVGLMFSSSVIDKYSSHVGGMLDVNYHLFETLGLGVTAGYMHGSLTPIVTDDKGIIGNKLGKCLEPNGSGAANCDLTPKVPDFDQITGILSFTALWSPLYGKINVVSEGDVNLQIYGIFGAGVNGTRRVEAQAQPGAAAPGDYAVIGGKAGEGGAFANMKVHANLGFGLKIFFADWFAVRGELHDILWRDSFDFQPNDTTDEETPFLSHHYFANVGASFILF